MSTSEVKATCVVHTAFDVSVTWLLDGSVSSTDAVMQAANTTHIISDLTVSLSQWKQLKFVTCRAEHKCFSFTQQTVTVAGEMVLKEKKRKDNHSFNDHRRCEIIN